MKKIISLVLFFTAGNCFAQQVTFQKTFGGTNADQGFSTQQTMDGGYIIAGGTQILGAGADDVYLIKTDVNGDSLWTKTFGGTNSEEGFSVQQTSDGGYIIAGFTDSFGVGYSDVYLIKTDANGDSLWTKTFGGTGFDDGKSVQQTTDGGYIICGVTNSFGGGNDDVYLIKADANGNSLWTKTFGGTGNDLGYSVQQTADSGYIVSGSTENFGAGDFDVYLIKTNVNGDSLWTKTFGGTSFEGGNFVRQTSDGGYIIAGNTHSFGAGNWDVYLIKTNVNGDSLWTKTFGGTNYDWGNAVRQTTDGGYIISGFTFSFGAGNFDVYLIKTDANGDSLWTKTFGGTGFDDDWGNSIRQTVDGGYIIAGYTRSFSSGYDVYLIKTDSLGNSGCNEGSTATIVTTPATQVTSPATIVTSPATIVTTPATIVGSGGTVTTLCTTVGISPTPALPGGEGVAIAPNPATNNFTITFPNTINKGIIEIYNVLGEKIFKEDVFNVSQKEILIDNINAGIYFVKVRVYPDSFGDWKREYGEKVVIE